MKEGSHNKTQRVRKVQNIPTYLSSKKISGGQQEEGHGVAHHVQWEDHQSYLLHHYQNAGIQGRQIQFRKDQMQVTHVNKNMVEQSALVLVYFFNSYWSRFSWLSLLFIVIFSILMWVGRFLLDCQMSAAGWAHLDSAAPLKSSQLLKCPGWLPGRDLDICLNVKHITGGWGLSSYQTLHSDGGMCDIKHVSVHQC